MPWVTHKLKKAIKKKYFLYNLLRRGLIQKSRYVFYKKLLNITSDKMRRLYYHKKFLNANNSRETWRTVNSFLGRNSKDPPLRVVSDDGTILKNVELSEYFK